MEMQRGDKGGIEREREDDRGMKEAEGELLWGWAWVCVIGGERK